MTLAHQLQHRRLHALGESLATPGARHGSEGLEHAVRKALLPVGVADGRHFIAVEQHHHQMLSAAAVHFLVPAHMCRQFVADGREVERAQRHVADQHGERRHQAREAVERHSPGMDLPAQLRARRWSRVGLPAAERVPVQSVEREAILDRTVFLRGAHRLQECVGIGSGGTEGRRGLAVLLHEGQQCAEQGGGDALSAVRPHHAPACADEGREAFVVGRPRAAEFEQQIADHPVTVQRDHPARFVHRPAPAQVMLEVSVAQDWLTRDVLLGADPPVRVIRRPLRGRRVMGVEGDDVDRLVRHLFHDASM